jgi:hypothetical protein
MKAELHVRLPGPPKIWSTSNIFQLLPFLFFLFFLLTSMTFNDQISKCAFLWLSALIWWPVFRVPKVGKKGISLHLVTRPMVTGGTSNTMSQQIIDQRDSRMWPKMWFSRRQISTRWVNRWFCSISWIWTILAPPGAVARRPRKIAGDAELWSPELKFRWKHPNCAQKASPKFVKVLAVTVVECRTVQTTDYIQILIPYVCAL